MAIYITELSSHNLTFPSPYEAMEDPNGLLAFGGDLSKERIYAAYQQGIFPWYGPGEPILWWSPAPRATFDPATYTPSRSLKKFQKKHNYTVSINQATKQVIQFCGQIRPEEETWLNTDMQNAYIELSKQGDCHSVEVWEEEKLIGGLYGIQVGQLFCGESMFSLQSNASKVALWYFCHHFQKHGGKLIDCQVMNPHLASLGATEQPRDEFFKSLLLLKNQTVNAHCFRKQWLASPLEEHQ
ncbi:leucyl/phenylalanyl-tRNA--protein transferase [Vibrio sp. ZSDE26]|uniref:Leucyl/phenylalanyl-tRNA--protein transferase n=1 Tax=Vibrio amylolyticus TaxID=2847292 RepID=A0A9X1XLT9_9VIBR|nr:leucyl/phenylalanyl-tRNA--protein transferase [Vibrio amylolyticus]MCK6261969.1 leucyl/phenylalanyl-tRNA--protein transferase [Vibrio amylolyticus]